MKRKSTFENDHIEAVRASKQCRQSLAAFFPKTVEVDSSMLTFEEQAALATEQRRRANIDPLVNTKLAGVIKTTASDLTHHPKLKMDPFWDDIANSQGFTSFPSFSMTPQSAMQLAGK